ncbi:hypothetical protein Tco_1207603, partial [Tanacetum coccineum]
MMPSLDNSDAVACNWRRCLHALYAFLQDNWCRVVDNDSDVEEDSRSNSEFLTDLNADFHDTAFLANQKRLYKRMDNPNITMEEYIRLEEEKARKHGKVFNWETAKYGKIWYDEDIHNLISIETEFPAITFNDQISSEKTLSCEPAVSSLNKEIDFKISFDDSNDEDYTVIFDKNSFSYKIISTNDLKTDSENDNENVNMPSLSPPEPTVSCFDDLDFFKDFENEFPAIVYNDARTSKSDLAIRHMALPPRDQRHQYVRCEGLQYTDADIVDFKTRLTRIYRREGCLRSEFREAILDLDTLRALQFQLGGARRRLSWRQFIIPDKGDLRDYWEGISSAGDFLGTAPSYTFIRDPILRLCHRYLRLFTAGRKSKALISGGQFVARLAKHFRLLTEERLQGLTVIAPALPVIDIAELVRLQICVEINDTWACIALGPERQP